MKRSLLHRLENALEPFAVTGLGYYLVLGQAAVWLLTIFRPTFSLLLQLDFAKMFEAGEWWRAFTFIIAPPLPGMPFTGGHIFMIFGWLFFCTMTSALEGIWGKVRANLFVYLCAGLLGLTAAADYFVFKEQLPSQILALLVGIYMFESVFLTFAYRFPDFPVRLMFVLEIKVAWMAWAVWAYLLLSLFNSIAFIPLFVGILIPFLIANGKDLWQRHIRHHLRPRHEMLKNREPLLETAAYAASKKRQPEPAAAEPDGYEWYYEDDEKPNGPVTTQALMNLMNLAEISPATRIWRKGMDDWEPLLKRPEFASALPGGKAIT